MSQVEDDLTSQICGGHCAHQEARRGRDATRWIDPALPGREKPGGPGTNFIVLEGGEEAVAATRGEEGLSPLYSPFQALPTAPLLRLFAPIS